MTRGRHAGGLCVMMLLGGLFLLLAGGCGNGGNPEGVGNHCSVDADCQTNECYIGPGGGYCTSPCADEGETAGCPADTVCKPIQGGARRCLLICGSPSSCGEESCEESFCPEGSSCVSVSNTTLRGCEPSPG